ncbi:multiple sugar transport system permease protein [Diaminobutyricimonas aerilata]|uniref:Multiple sugar transport system permease protein n=1 Tax=Diaminobutyricimonas aerilata TaxID=1162967 RepID=A0A2M9CN64_9MICO|nr:sugar ABC transporter permease [Diaminobutyricimonas aerilata]PJJ73343.1 multiple sugar transport system permease protein [Diaminobutyricimonas aerilata]
MASITNVGAARRVAAPTGGGKKGQGWVALAYLWPGLTGFVVFIVVPLVGSLVISLFEWPLFGSPTFIGVANYEKLFGDPTFYTVLFNTVVFAFVYTALNLALALGIALWLNTRLRFAGFWRVIFFLPAITPMVANALIWRLLLSQDGLVNSLLGGAGVEGPSWLSDSQFALASVIAMSVWQSFGYNVIVLSAGLGAIPKEILEASRMDGTTAWTRLRHIILPMLSPALFFTMTMTMIGAFQVFVQPQILTQGGPGEATNTFVLYLYRNGFVFDRLGYASALAWMLFLVVMLITALQFAGQRRWVNYDK